MYPGSGFAAFGVYTSPKLAEFRKEGIGPGFNLRELPRPKRLYCSRSSTSDEASGIAHLFGGNMIAILFLGNGSFLDSSRRSS